jgi:integrase
MQIRSLPFVEGQQDYPDDAVSGLAIRVGRKTKSFLLTVRHGTKRQRITLGHYPDLSLSKAREAARDRLAEARLKPQESPTLRFSEAFDTFERLHLPTIRPGTRYECERSLRKYWLPALASKHLTDLTTPMIAGILDRIEKPAEKRNAFVWIRAFLNWHSARGHLDMNPAARLKGLGASKSRDRVLTDAELVAIWNASGEGNFRAFVRLLILSGQRRGQWHAFEPSMIDHENRVIVWPAGAMKSARPHAIPLTDTILRTIGNHTFTGWNSDYRKQWLQRQSATSGWTFHDLRRTAATGMAEIGIAPHVIEKILAHATPGVAARYNRHPYLAEMRQALDEWDEHLSRLLFIARSAS